MSKKSLVYFMIFEIYASNYPIDQKIIKTCLDVILNGMNKENGIYKILVYLFDWLLLILQPQ